MFRFTEPSPDQFSKQSTVTFSECSHSLNVTVLCWELTWGWFSEPKHVAKFLMLITNICCVIVFNTVSFEDTLNGCEIWIFYRVIGYPVLGEGGLYFIQFISVCSGLLFPRVNTGLFWILHRFVTRPSITGYFVDFIYCQLCEINFRNTCRTQYVLAIGKQARSSFRPTLFILPPAPTNGHASETRLYSSVFSLFFQFL